MNIKSLLLGSAAALVAVSGARAADAIIAEPEPVEYVRVCDVYGAGFFYIPGTETCLDIGGRVRYEIRTNSAVDGWLKNTNMRLEFDARNETEWGTLRSFIRLQTNNGGNVDGDVLLDQGVIQLGGLWMGYTESAFVSAWGAPIGGFGILHSDAGGSYAYQQRNQIGYRFSGGNGFFGSITLEDDMLADEGYMPDVVGMAGIVQGWGGVWAKIGYDESAEEFGVTAGAQVNLANMPGSSLKFGGWYASNPNAYAVAMPISGASAEWSGAISYNHAFRPNLAAGIGYQYLNDFANDDAHMVQAYVLWTPVTQFEIRLEGTWAQEDNVAIGTDDDVWGGLLRFSRYF